MLQHGGWLEQGPYTRHMTLHGPVLYWLCGMQAYRGFANVTLCL